MSTYEVTNQGCPPHIFDQVIEAEQVWGRFVPSWIHFVRITFDPNDTGTLCTQIMEEYRTVYIRICGGWTKVTVEEHGKFLLHEIMHVYTHPLYTLFLQLLTSTTEETLPLYKWAEEEARKAAERCTNDLEQVIWQHFR